MIRDKASLLSTWRIIVPLTVLLTTVVSFWFYEYPLSDNTTILMCWLSRLDPWLLLAEWRATGALPIWFWLPLGVVVLTILFGRVFCGWICPVGAIVAQIPVRRSHLKLSQHLQKGRYLWLVFLLMLLLYSNWPLFLTPFHILTEELTRIWQGKFPYLLISMLLAGILFFPRFWCVYVCPTGILLVILSRWRLFHFVIGEGCIECKACESVCRSKAMSLEESKAKEDCMLCGRCWQVCPVGMVKGQNRNVFTTPEKNDAMPLSRRQLVKGGLALVAGGFSWKYLGATAASVLRPPGALAEEEFLASCSRCGRCVKVCPAQCLFPMPIESGLSAFLTPRLQPRLAKCELCLTCQEVCPTGAIQHVPVSMVKMGIAELDRRQCLVWAERKLCLLCREQCPVHAIEVDENNRPYVNSNLCVGCGGCENGCPLSKAAIVVRPIEK